MVQGQATWDLQNMRHRHIECLYFAMAALEYSTVLDQEKNIPLPNFLNGDTTVSASTCSLAHSIMFNPDALPYIPSLSERNGLSCAQPLSYLISRLKKSG